MKQIKLVGFILGLAVAAFCSANWPNEPSGTGLLDCGFDNPTCNGALWDVYGGARITSLSDATISAPNVLVSSLIYPSLTGGMELTYPANAGSAKSMREMFVALRWRTNSGFEGNRPGGNKLFFMRANNWTMGAPRTNGYFYQKGPANSFPHTISFSHNTGGLDNSHTCGADLGLICSPNVNTTPIFPGNWYTIEAYVKASSCNTCKDGIVRWWVNGVLNGDYTNVNYGANILNEFTWAQTWDGTPTGNPCCATQDWHHYVDHVLIKQTNGIPNPSYLIITTGSLTGRSGTAFSATLGTKGGTGPFTWSVTGGTMTPGLTLSPSGVLSGTPTSGGKFVFSVKVTDKSVPPLTATGSITMVVSGAASIAQEKQLNDYGIGIMANGAADRVDFNLRFAKDGKFSVKVFDLQGKSVWNYSAANTKNNFADAVWNHGGNLTKGVYLVRAEQNGKSLTTRYSHIW